MLYKQISRQLVRRETSAPDGFCDELAGDLQGDDTFIITEEVISKMFHLEKGSYPGGLVGDVSQSFGSDRTLLVLLLIGGADWRNQTDGAEQLKEVTQ